MRWGVAAPAQQSRNEAAKQAKETAKQVDAMLLRQEIRDVVEVAWKSGNPLNKAGIKAKIERKTSVVGTAITNLLDERLMYEIDVPSKDRVGNSKAAFLVNLTNEEHEALVRGEGPPAAKMEIPPSWKKSAIPLVPKADSEIMATDPMPESISLVPVSLVP